MSRAVLVIPESIASGKREALPLAARLPWRPYAEGGSCLRYDTTARATPITNRAATVA